MARGGTPAAGGLTTFRRLRPVPTYNAARPPPSNFGLECSGFCAATSWRPIPASAAARRARQRPPAGGRPGHCVSTRKFGMPWTPKRCARSGCLSVSTLSTSALPARSRATAATSGAAMRHGPHQAAQKSTRTGTCDCPVAAANSAGSASIGSAGGGKAVLHAPQRASAVNQSSGIRFFLPQDGQARSIEKVKREREKLKA